MIAKAVTGVLVFSAVIGALVAGSRMPIEEPRSPSETTVSVTPARQDVACPGPLTTPSGGTGTDPELGGAPTDVTRSTYLDGTARPVGAGQASDAVVGAAVERVGGGDITGLAAVTCTAPLTDQWLVGGATVVGASARLVLANPSDTSVEATITAYGELGALDSREVAIGPDAQEEVLLEGVVVDVAALAIHISATGTGVVAAMQDSRLDGFQPYGTDWVTASAVGADLVIPGVGTGGSAAETATVRLVAPEGATARLTLSTPEGSAVWEGVAALELEPGVVVEVAIPAADEGTVVVAADAPIAAAAIVTRGRTATAGVEGARARELRWVATQDPNDESERAAVAVGYSARVVVFAKRTGTFLLTDQSGREVARAELSLGETASVPIDVAPGTVLVANGAFSWAIVTEDGELATSTTPTRTTIEAKDIVVRQERYVPSP
jgi:hypothetical protein